MGRCISSCVLLEVGWGRGLGVEGYGKGFFEGIGVFSRGIIWVGVGFRKLGRCFLCY